MVVSTIAYPSTLVLSTYILCDSFNRKQYTTHSIHKLCVIVEQAYCGINYATTKHSLRAALQLSSPDVQHSVTLNYSYLPVLVKLIVTKY